MLKSWDFTCETCGHYEVELFEQADRDLEHYCPECGSSAYKYKISANVSTSKTSQSYPDGVRRQEFKRIKANIAARRALRNAVRRGDKEKIKEAFKENVERGNIKK